MRQGTVNNRKDSNDITSEIGAITLYRLQTYLDFGKQ
jgi:hypothetical protein